METTTSRPPVGCRPSGALARLREELAARHYGSWVQREVLAAVRNFIRSRRIGSRRQIGRAEVVGHLEAIAVRHGAVAAAAACWALVFFCRHVLDCHDTWLDGLLEAHPSRRWPRPLARVEVRSWLARLDEPERLVAMLIYGSGLTVGECLDLRLRDLDPKACRLQVGRCRSRRRVTVVAARAAGSLARQLARVQRRHLDACRRGAGWVAVEPVPVGGPRRSRRLEWQFLFPATPPPLSGPLARGQLDCRLHPVAVEAALADAARRAGLGSTVDSASLRHAFATHLLEDGVEPEQVRTLLGVAEGNVRPTIPGGLRSPLDAL